MHIATTPQAAIQLPLKFHCCQKQRTFEAIPVTEGPKIVLSGTKYDYQKKLGLYHKQT